MTTYHRGKKDRPAPLQGRPTSGKGYFHLGLALGSVLGFLATSNHATAQSLQEFSLDGKPVIVGGSGQPSVEVDLDAIDARPLYVTPRLLYPKLNGNQSHIRLRPPGSSASAGTERLSPPRFSLAAPPQAPTLTMPETPPPPTPPAPPKMEASGAPQPVAPPEASDLARTEEDKTESAKGDVIPPLPKAEADTLARVGEPTPAPLKPVQSSQLPKTDGGTAPKAAPMPDMPPAPPSSARSESTQTSVAPPPPPLALAETPPPKAGAKSEQQASLPPASAATAGREDKLRILFAPGEAGLPETATAALDTLAARFEKDEKLRLQLIAYAEGDKDSVSQARRLSLSRALTVRSYLIDKGVRSTRMDVRALGNKYPEGPGDRVDIVTIGP